MIRFVEAFCRSVDKVAGLLLALVTILIVASAIGRYLLAAPIPDAFDLSRFLIGACIMWGFASIGYRGGHINVDLFVEMMPRRWRRRVDVFAWSILLVFVVLLSWKMAERVASAYASNEATFDLQLPAWPFLGLIWLGAVASIGTVSVTIFLLATGRGSIEHSEMEALTSGKR